MVGQAFANLIMWLWMLIARIIQSVGKLNGRSGGHDDVAEKNIVCIHRIKKKTH